MMVAQMQGPRGQGQKRRQQAEGITIEQFVPCQSELQVAHLEKRDICLYTAKTRLRAASGLEAFWVSVRISDGVMQSLSRATSAKKMFE